MSGNSSWLQKQRKSELVELAESVGLKISDGLKKIDIEAELESFLKSNPSLSSDTRVAPFYKQRRSDGSPVKREVSSSIAEGEKLVKTVKRRATKAGEELTNAVSTALTDDSEAEPIGTRVRAITRTPRTSALAFAQNVPLPPSPSVVADAIDRRTAALRTQVSKAYEDSGIVETAQAARESLSSVVSVELLIIAFEAFYLRKEVLADRYAFTIPAIAALRTAEYPVLIPDLFLLLTASFWGPVSLWALTSLLGPLFASYFLNLTHRPKAGRSHALHFNYAFDPLTFNIVKALLTYVIFVQDNALGGLVDLEYVARINSALYGGPSGVLVGCGIGILVTFYEAIIRK